MVGERFHGNPHVHGHGAINQSIIWIIHSLFSASHHPQRGAHTVQSHIKTYERDDGCLILLSPQHSQSTLITLVLFIPIFSLLTKHALTHPLPHLLPLSFFYLVCQRLVYLVLFPHLSPFFIILISILLLPIDSSPRPTGPNPGPVSSLSYRSR